MSIKLPIPPKVELLITTDQQGKPVVNQYVLREIRVFFEAIFKILSLTINSIAWGSIGFTGSKLTDIETRRHENLQGVAELNTASVSVEKDKHLSNAQGKTWQDHMPMVSTHGIATPSVIVGTETAQTLKNKTLDGTNKYGSSATHLVVDDNGDAYFVGSGSGFPHGSMYATNAGIAVVITVADTFVEIGSGITGGLENLCTFQNAHEIKVTKAGRYFITYSISGQTASVANKEMEGAIMINNAAQSQGSAHAEVSPGGSNRPETVSGSGIFTLAVNDVVSLAVSNHTDTTDFVIEHLSLSLIQVGG